MAKKILLADDSVTIQKVVELTFMDEDYEVTAVSNGDEALAQLDELAPDLVIADVHMPGADGFQVCREAKQRRPGLPVLLLVGTFEPFQEEEVAAAGGDGFLKKPFDSQELLRRVEELLGAVAPEAEPSPEEEIDEEVGATSIGEMESWGTVEEELDDDVASPEEVWQGEPLEVESERLEDPLPDLGPAEELELEASPWTLAENEKEGPEPLTGQGAPSAPPAYGEEDEGAVTDRLGPSLAAVAELAETDAPAAEPTTPSLPDGVAASTMGSLSDQDVERIARRVAEILGEAALRDVAWEVVPDLAELVIRDRVRELERQLE